MNFNMELSEITAEDTVEDTMSMASAHTASEENVGGTCECMREGGRKGDAWPLVGTWGTR